MLSRSSALGLKVILGVVAIVYGGLNLEVLINTRQWLLIPALVLVIGLVGLAARGYPLHAIWPIFPGLLLMLACGLNLMLIAPPDGPLSNTRQELVVGILIGVLLYSWGIYTASRIAVRW